MDEQVLINDTDQEPTDTCMRNSEIMESRIDCFVIKDTKPEWLEILTEFATTSDHMIVCAQERLDQEEGTNVSWKVMGWDIDRLKQ